MSATRILKKRKEACATLEEIYNGKKHYFLIHYSCESFYENPDGHSARITSIAIRNLASGQTQSFSIHQYAERNHIASDQIASSYDELEKKMLKSFYEFVKKNSLSKWIHWNMRDINYGFEAINHRYKVLGGTPHDILDENRIDLARLLISLYSPKYIGHPRIEKLVARNKITTKDFLTGKEEAEAFEQQQYVKLHQSTLRKVDIFANIIGRIEDNSLRTNETWLSKNILYPEILLEWLRNHWIVKFCGVILILAGIYKIFWPYIISLLEWCKSMVFPFITN